MCLSHITLCKTEFLHLENEGYVSYHRMSPWTELCPPKSLCRSPIPMGPHLEVIEVRGGHRLGPIHRAAVPIGAGRGGPQSPLCALRVRPWRAQREDAVRERAPDLSCVGSWAHKDEPAEGITGNHQVSQKPPDGKSLGEMFFFPIFQLPQGAWRNLAFHRWEESSASLCSHK